MFLFSTNFTLRKIQLQSGNNILVPRQATAKWRFPSSYIKQTSVLPKLHSHQEPSNPPRICMISFHMLSTYIPNNTALLSKEISNCNLNSLQSVAMPHTMIINSWFITKTNCKYTTFFGIVYLYALFCPNHFGATIQHTVFNNQ